MAVNVLRGSGQGVLLMTVETKWYGNEFLKSLENAFVKGIDDSAKPVLDDAKRFCPRDRGHLVSTGAVKKARRDGDEVYSVVEFSADYAIYVEMKQPFLRRALMANESKSLKNFENKL